MSTKCPKTVLESLALHLPKAARFAPALEACLKAGEELMSRFVDKSLQVIEKSDGTLVTEADFASNRVLIDALRQHFPDDGILSEEVPRDESELSRVQLWIVDPLDGTARFVAGEDDFCILLAMVEDGSPQFSVAYFPAREKCLVAHAGSGAYALPQGKKLSVSASPALRSQRVYERLCSLTNQEVVAPGYIDSGDGLVRVAEGSLDGAVIRMGRHQEWDLAAPTLLIKEAGGTVSDEIDQQVLFGSSPLSIEYFVVSNTLCHQELMSSLPK